LKTKNEIEVQNHVADHYVEKRYKGLGLKYHTAIIKEMMEGIHGKILDVGTGVGIIHNLYPDLDIIGIDISQGMLRHHRGKCLLASADNIPFDDNHFDSVVCRSVLHHLHDPKKALQEIRRVLKPGGRFVCWETNKSWIAEIIRRMTQHGDNFSNAHTSFDDLPNLVTRYLDVRETKFQGFVCYPLAGFPDILDFSRCIWPFYWLLSLIDYFLSKIPLINRLGFAIMIKAIK
jgi:ubiquinone/menaquinone biosynthesis C-methylase UbiE